DVLRALPEDTVPQRRQVLASAFHSREVIAGELAHLAGEDARTVREEDLRFADSARVEKELAGCGEAGVVFIGQVEVQVSERDPAGLTTPATVDEHCADREHGEEGCAGPGRSGGLEEGGEVEAGNMNVDRVSHDGACRGV